MPSNSCCAHNVKPNQEGALLTKLLATKLLGNITGTRSTRKRGWKLDHKRLPLGAKTIMADTSRNSPVFP